MAGFPERVTLGRSGLVVGPLGVAGGYGVDAAAIRKAVDRGCSYLYHGSRRAPGMRSAIRELTAAGRRDELVVVLQSYARWPWLLERGITPRYAHMGVTKPGHGGLSEHMFHQGLDADTILEKIRQMAG